MRVPVYNTAGKEVDTIELPASVFEAKINRDLMHQALVRQMANARLGTHKAKDRSEVNRTTAKAYRQKGTGNARHGSRRAPIFVGGGVAHGPRPRKYTKKMPRQMRRAALRSALSVKAQNGDLLVLENVAFETPRTKEFVSLVNNVAGGRSVLLLMAEDNENVVRSARNVADAKILRAGYLNVRDLLGFEKILVPLSALAVVNGFLSSEVAASLTAEEEE